MTGVCDRQAAHRLRANAGLLEPALRSLGVVRIDARSLESCVREVRNEGGRLVECAVESVETVCRDVRRSACAGVSQDSRGRALLTVFAARQRTCLTVIAMSMWSGFRGERNSVERLVSSSGSNDCRRGEGEGSAEVAEVEVERLQLQLRLNRSRVWAAIFRILGVGQSERLPNSSLI